MAQQETRHFQLSDDQVIVYSGVVKDHFVRHHETFFNFNNVKFHMEYHTDLAGIITTAKNSTSDGFVLKSQAKETADVRDISKAIEKNLRKLAYNVKSRFGDELSILKEFRLMAISEFTSNPDTFIGYIKDVLGVVNKYKTELLEEGLQEELLTTIQEQLLELDDQRREQIDAIQSRPVHTKTRIASMNHLWKHLVDIRDASDIVFDESPEISALFSLPKQITRSSEDEEVIEEIS